MNETNVAEKTRPGAPWTQWLRRAKLLQRIAAVALAAVPFLLLLFFLAPSAAAYGLNAESVYGLIPEKTGLGSCAIGLIVLTCLAAAVAVPLLLGEFDKYARPITPPFLIYATILEFCILITSAVLAQRIASFGGGFRIGASPVLAIVFSALAVGLGIFYIAVFFHPNTDMDAIAPYLARPVKISTHNKKQAASAASKPAATSAARRLAFTQTSEFGGKAIPYFFIGVAVKLGSLLSLGIAYPFLFCWRLKWVTKHTKVDGQQLVFDGNGIQLIGRYLLWILLCVVTLGIYLIFFMPLNWNRWETKHTHFLHAQGGESHFDGHIWQLFGVRLLTRFVTLITLGLGSFWAHCYRERWYAKHTVYDGVRIAFHGKGWQYFLKKIVWLLLTVVTIGIYGLFLGQRVKRWTISYTHRAA